MSGELYTTYNLHDSSESMDQSSIMANQTEKERRAMLAKLHEECDSYDTGVVRTTNLVEKLRLLVKDNPAVDKELLNELSRLLDPKDDDGHVKKEEFITIGMDWINIVDEKCQIIEATNKGATRSPKITRRITEYGNSSEPNITYSINSSNSFDVERKIAPSNTTKNDGTFTKVDEKIFNGPKNNMTVASFGLLDSAVFKDSYFDMTSAGNEITYDCYGMADNDNLYRKNSIHPLESSGHLNSEGIMIHDLRGSQNDFGRNEESSENVAHRKESFSNLVHMNKRMSLETVTLKKQLVSAESEAALIQSENDILKKQLNKTKNDLRKSLTKTPPKMLSKNRRHSTDALLEKENLKNTFQLEGYSTVESLDNTNSDQNCLDQNEVLQEENVFLQKEVQQFKKLLCESQRQEKNTIEKVDSLEYELSVKTNEIARLQQNKSERSNSDTKTLEESKLMIHRLEDEIQKLKADLTTALDEISQMSLHQTQDNWRDVFSEKGQILAWNASEISFEDNPDTSKVTSEFGSILPVQRSVSAPKRNGITFIRGKGPKAASTPFHPTASRVQPLRDSIGDEMKRLGIDGSPLFDKKKEKTSKQKDIHTRMPAKMSKGSGDTEISSCSGPDSIRKSTFTKKVDRSTQTSISYHEQENTSTDICYTDFQPKLPKSLTDIKLIASFAQRSIVVFLANIAKKPLWFRIILSFVALLIFFTFFGAYEVDERKYYPMTWPKRLDDWLEQRSSCIRIPKPVAFLSKKHIYPPNVY